MGNERRLVFVSYSREDVEWRRRFETMLKPAARRRHLEVWSDERNVVGEEWRPQLAQAISNATAALVLVSPDFLASDFILEQELPALLDHDVRLVCVLVRPCFWQEEPALERVQWGHDPGRDGALAESGRPEGQIVRVCQAVLDAIAPESGEVDGAEGEHPVVPVSVPTNRVAPSDRIGDLHGVPPLPPAFVGRQELDVVRKALLAGDDGAVGVTGRPVGLQGQGGIGKTVLAVALAHDETIRRSFPDGIYWVTIGERGDLMAAQHQLLAAVGAARFELRSVTEGAVRLRSVFAERRCLLVIDDVWTVAAAAAFRAAGPEGRVLYTARDPQVVHGVGAQLTEIDVLPDASARELLRNLTDEQALPPAADRILDATGRVALAVALVGASIRGTDLAGGAGVM